jgi:hypothetical protein
VPALLQLIQRGTMGVAHVASADVLCMLAAQRSGADAIMAAGGARVLTAALQQYLQQGEVVAAAAAAAGEAAGGAGGAGGAAGGAAVASSQADAVSSIAHALHLTALHEAHTAAVQAALQPLAPQLARLLAQLEAEQWADGAPPVLVSWLVLLLALLQTPSAVLEAAGPGVAGWVAVAVPTLHQHRRQLVADVQAVQAAQEPGAASTSAAAAPDDPAATAATSGAAPAAAASAALGAEALHESSVGTAVRSNCYSSSRSCHHLLQVWRHCLVSMGRACRCVGAAGLCRTAAGRARGPTGRSTRAAARL